MINRYNFCDIFSIVFSPSSMKGSLGSLYYSLVKRRLQCSMRLSSVAQYKNLWADHLWGYRCVSSCISKGKQKALLLCCRKSLLRYLSMLLVTNNTVFENHRKSLIQYCERSELRLHFEWTKVHEKCQKWSIWRVFENLKLAVKQCYQNRSLFQ